MWAHLIFFRIVLITFLIILGGSSAVPALRRPSHRGRQQEHHRPQPQQIITILTVESQRLANN